MTNEQVARICHEANKGLCQSHGDDSQKTWDDAPKWQRDSAMAGVDFARANPDAPDSAQHDAWMRDKVAAGWTYGETKDADTKTHPCLVPFEQLPEFQKAKDTLFRAIVKALS